MERHPLRAFGWVAGLIGVVGCAPIASVPTAPGADPVAINGAPTGSIIVPSLCERASTDARVTLDGADSFAFIWAGDRYQVVYADTSTHALTSVQLDSEGKVLAPAVIVEARPDFAALPSLLASGAGYVVAWEEHDAAGTALSVRVHRLDLSGHPVGDGRTVASGPSTQMRPVLSRSPVGVAISWMQQSLTDKQGLTTVGDSHLAVGILDDTLALRTDLTPLSMDTRAGYPWLAGDDHGVALLWTSDHQGGADTHFASLGPTLAMDTPTNVRMGTSTNAALLGRLLLTDFGYIAAWEDLRSGEEEIYMTLLDPSGVPMKSGLVEEPDTGNANWPHMAWTGSTAAVVYYQFRGGKPQIFMTFVDSDGERVGGAADAQISNTTSWARFPDVAWTGAEFGALWVDARDGHPELYFNRVRCEKPAPI